MWSADELKELLHGEVGLQVESEEFRNIMAKDPLLGMQIYDYRSYLGSQLLMKVDKFTMINNLEARAPYLDSKVIDLAFRLSERDKIRGIHGKYILRKVAERYLPKEIAWRVKRGFSLPLGKWFRTDYRDLVEQGIEILGSYRSIFNLGVYREIVAEHMAMKGEKDYRDKIWAMTVLALWMNHYKVGE